MYSGKNSSPVSSPMALTPKLTPESLSPEELSLYISANVRNLSDSHENWTSLFDNDQPIMSIQQGLINVNLEESTAPYLGFDSPVSAASTITAPETRKDESGVSYYNPFSYANINPAYSDEDLFNDSMSLGTIGEDFVWIENLFEDSTPLINDIGPTPEDTAAMSIIAAYGASTIASFDNIHS